MQFQVTLCVGSAIPPLENVELMYLDYTNDFKAVDLNFRWSMWACKEHYAYSALL